MVIGIVGINGFVGSRLAKKHLSMKDTVYGFGNNNFDNVPQGTESIIPNKNIYLRPGTINIDFDCLYISIGNHKSSCQNMLEQIYTVQSVVDGFRYKKLIFISSNEIYRTPYLIRASNESGDENVYGLSKRIQERIVQGRATIIRPPYIYGDGMDKDSLIPFWKDRVKENKDLYLYSNGEWKQDYIHIDDLIEFCYIVSKDDKIDILSPTSENYSNLEVANIIKKYMNGAKITLCSIKYKESIHNDSKDIQEKYNWKPTHTLEEWIKNEISNL